MIETTKRCDLCDTVLEMRDDRGQRLAFTAHTAEFCADGVRLKLRTYERVLRDEKLWAHERELGLRRELDRLTKECNELRHESARNADGRIGSEADPYDR